MKLKTGIIALVVSLSTIASASLYTFSDVGYSVAAQQNWADVTDGGALSGSASYGGGYPGMSPWFAGISADDGSAVFNKDSGSGYIGSAGTYSPGGSGGTFSVSGLGTDADTQSVVLVVKGGGSEYAVLLTDNNGQVRGGTKTALREDTYTSFMGTSTYYYNAYQVNTIGMDLSDYSISFGVAPHGQVSGLQVDEATFYAAIPEPATMGFMGLTAGGLFILRRLRIIA